MLTIRFARVGKKNKAQFKIMLQEKSMAPGGRHVEILGSWDPYQKKATFKDERIKYWVEKGASVSDSVYNLLVSKGVLLGKKRKVKITKKKGKETAAEGAEKAPVTEGETKPEKASEEVKAEASKEEKKKEEKAEEKAKEEPKDAPEKKIEEEAKKEVSKEEDKK